MRQEQTISTLQAINKDVHALVARAKAACEGCRLSWRVRRDSRHGEPMPIVCTAQDVRQQLREMSPMHRNRKHAKIEQ